MSGLIPPETLATLVFFGLIVFTFCGALIAVAARNILHAVLGLVIALAGVAGFYLYLGSEFVAMMQLLIYVGAICISIMFAIMLSEPLYRPPAKKNPVKVVLSLVVSVIFAAILWGVVGGAEWTKAVPVNDDWSVGTLGVVLLTRYNLIFELISLVLLVAIIGAIVTARRIRLRRESE